MSDWQELSLQPDPKERGMYAISARRHIVRESEDGTYTWDSHEDLPTFYLDENVQGIISEAQAEEIARQILGSGKYTITAVRI